MTVDLDPTLREALRGEFERLSARRSECVAELRAIDRKLAGIHAILDESPPQENRRGGATTTVRELILRQVESAYPQPIRVADLRRQVIGLYGAPIHEKTCGMALWRLSKEQPPRVRREGTRDWYFIPQGLAA